MSTTAKTNHAGAKKALAVSEQFDFEVKSETTRKFIQITACSRVRFRTSCDLGTKDAFDSALAKFAPQVRVLYKINNFDIVPARQMVFANPFQIGKGGYRSPRLARDVQAEVPYFARGPCFLMRQRRW